MNHQYHVALSFAGEDRPYVDQVATHLRQRGVKVFYDDFERVSLWGTNLYTHFSDVYRNKALFAVMFISQHYAQKVWTSLERESMQARALEENKTYILPARFDDTEIPGLLHTIAYENLAKQSPSQFAELICDKLVQSGVALTPKPPSPSSRGVSPVSTSETVISVRDSEGRPIEGAHISLVAENGTYLQALSDSGGRAVIKVAKRRKFTIYCSHNDYPAFYQTNFDPVNDLQLTLPRLEGIGSLTYTTSRGGLIPNFSGGISPVHDSSDRLYLYASNIAVDGGKLQPVPFEIDKPLHIEDVEGRELYITFRVVIGRIFLVEYSANVE